MGMKNLLTTTLLSVGLAGGASASTFDFNDAALQDTLVDQVTTSDGAITATLDVSANRNSSNRGANRVHEALIFDTENGADGDADLQSGFRRDGGSDFSFAGGVLAISENDLSAGDLPDDNANGGSITFNFLQAVNFTGFSIYDDASITVTADNGASFSAGVHADAAFNDFLIGDERFFNVSSLTFDFGYDSGAIDNLEISAVPLPAGLPLLLAGLGALGIAGRRRRTQA
jgi:hypothetical protein